MRSDFSRMERTPHQTSLSAAVLAVEPQPVPVQTTATHETR